MKNNLNKIIPKDNVAKALLLIIIILLVIIFLQNKTTNSSEISGYNLKANESCQRLQNSTICVYEIEMNEEDRNQCMYVMYDKDGKELFTNSLNCKMIKNKD